MDTTKEKEQVKGIEEVGTRRKIQWKVLANCSWNPVAGIPPWLLPSLLPSSPLPRYPWSHHCLSIVHTACTTFPSFHFSIVLYSLQPFLLSSSPSAILSLLPPQGCSLPSKSPLLLLCTLLPPTTCHYHPSSPPSLPAFPVFQSHSLPPSLLTRDLHLALKRKVTCRENNQLV